MAVSRIHLSSPFINTIVFRLPNGAVSAILIALELYAAATWSGWQQMLTLIYAFLATAATRGISGWRHLGVLAWA